MNRNLLFGTLIGLLIALGLVGGYVLLIADNFSYRAAVDDTPAVAVDTTASSTEDTTVATSTEMTEEIDETKTIIGTSAQGNPLTAFHFGTGEDELLFIGGIHGGYSWNTALVAYELIDYLAANEETIPANIKVTVIPVLNPDGLAAVVGTTSRFAAAAVPRDQEDTIKGRFNGNTVDLNRNFDCEWQESSLWQNTTVSGGSAPFSEPETAAVRDYVSTNEIAGAVVWYSAAGGVYASNCKDGVLTTTKDLTALYAEAAGYPAKSEFNFYEVTGDMVNWFAKERIPAISVLLTTHSDPEWTKNQAGVTALLEYYTE